MTSTPGDEFPAPGDGPDAAELTVDDIDLDLVADDRAGALDPPRALLLHALLADDPAAAGRYDGFARMLDGVSELLAAQPAPPLPDDVVRRLDAAVQREIDASTGHEAAVSRLHPSRRSVRGRSFRGWSFRGWAAGLVGVAALAGLVGVVVHGGGASSSASSSAAGRSRVGASLAGAAAAAPSAEAAGSASSRPAAAGSPERAPLLTRQAAQPPVVTAADLPSVVRALQPLASHPAPVATGGVTGPTPAVARVGGGIVVPAGCRPEGVPGSVALLAARPVRFAGRPAVLLVLAGPTDRPGTVRATVVAACGGPALLSQQVPAVG